MYFCHCYYAVRPCYFFLLLLLPFSVCLLVSLGPATRNNTVFFLLNKKAAMNLPTWMLGCPSATNVRKRTSRKMLRNRVTVRLPEHAECSLRSSRILSIGRRRSLHITLDTICCIRLQSTIPVSSSSSGSVTMKTKVGTNGATTLSRMNLSLGFPNLF